MTESAESNHFPFARALLSGLGGSAIAAFPCGVLYNVVAGPPSFGSGLAAIVGMFAGGLSGLFIGLAVSVRAHSVRVAGLSGRQAGLLTRRLAVLFFGLALLVALGPIVLLRTSGG
jgi:hypothetical protein